MRTLITGGSGFLGINLIRYFMSRGIDDIVVLDIADFDYPERDKVVFIKGDIRDNEGVSNAMRGASFVVHAAAALPLYKKDIIYSTDVEGTKILLDEVQRNNVDRFIHISSTAVYGIPDHHPLYENDALSGVGDYGRAKIRAEELCVEYRKKGMCIPVLRPKSFVGPERLGVFTLLYEWADEKRNFPIIGSGNNRYQLLDVEDMCHAIFLCATEEKETVNDVFNIGAKEFTTIREDYQAVLDAAGYGKKIISFPAGPAIMILRMLEFMRLSPLYKWVYETVSEDSFVSIEKAERKLNFLPKYSNKEALVRNFNWYLKNYHKFKGKTGISHRAPWNQGILNLVKYFF